MVGGVDVCRPPKTLHPDGTLLAIKRSAFVVDPVSPRLTSAAACAHIAAAVRPSAAPMADRRAVGAKASSPAARKENLNPNAPRRSVQWGRLRSRQANIFFPGVVWLSRRRIHSKMPGADCLTICLNFRNVCRSGPRRPAVAPPIRPFFRVHSQAPSCGYQPGPASAKTLRDAVIKKACTLRGSRIPILPRGSRLGPCAQSA
jgi:hypothetical protein